MLTVQSLRAIADADLTNAGLSRRDLDRAVSRMLGYIIDESEFASLGQDLKTRAAITRGTQKGTPAGELLRSVGLFKGFPIGMISRHWERMADTWHTGGRVSAVGYGASLIASTTLLGALVVQLRDLRDGKDPRDMTTSKFWGAAMMQGGGVGIFGDLLYAGTSGENRAGLSGGQTLWAGIGGPVVGSVAELYELTLGNLGQAARGEDTHYKAEALRFAKGHAPFVNLWYAKSAIDHAVLHDLQEQLSPGYLARMRRNVRKDWRQDYWWRPGKTLPRRGPDWARAAGR
jgi:hypothetical protein